MNLFNQNDKTFEELLSDLQNLAVELVAHNELPERGIIVTKKFGEGQKNKGEVISYQIFINEPGYPEAKDEERTTVLLLTIKNPQTKKWDGHVEIGIPNFILKKCGLPTESILSSQNQNDIECGRQRFKVPISSEDLIDWIRKVIQSRLDNYVSAADPFGCCSLFEKCSDARKCIHKNRLYSTACAYRVNLEAGRIFYGKNRNIE